MIKSTTHSIWNGTLKDGSGTMTLQSGAYSGPYSYASRFESESKQTNPEELIAAAHSGCFSMFLAALLTEAQLTPGRIDTKAEVTLELQEDGPKITSIHLTTHANVTGISTEQFQELVQKAKDNCPISKVLQGAERITVEAHLNQEA
tara:strand:- start:729 stop:1169 length:441 start_codon:yes stop_codon:yes gene_type:complete